MDHLKFEITPELAKHYGNFLRFGAENSVPGANALIEKLLNLFDGENISSIAVALSAVLAVVDCKIQNDGTTGAAQKKISISDVVRTGTPIYRKKLENDKLKEKVYN